MAQQYSVTSVPYNPNPNKKIWDLWVGTTQFFRHYTTPILKSVTRVFLQTASKYTPPGKVGTDGKQHLGYAAIPPEYYYCKIVDLVAARKAKDPKDRPHKEDIPWIKQGYKYKIIENRRNTKYKTIGYAKNIRYAKHMARIKNRGLKKYSWGSLLNNFQETTRQSQQFSQFTPDNVRGMYETELPATFRLLASKSPNIARYKWGMIKQNPVNMKKGQWSILIRNRQIKADDAWLRVAVKLGSNAAYKHWFSIVRAAQSGMVKKFEKYLNFNIRKVFIEYQRKAKD